MRTADMSRRIDAIAESVKTLHIKGTTRIDWNCLTCEERALFDKVNELKEEYSPGYPPDDVLEENHSLFVKGLELIMRRALDLFQEATRVVCLISSEDDMGFELVFTLRIFWFLNEMQRHSEKMRKEEELLNEFERVEDFEKAWKEYEETLEDRTPLWSTQSFENYVQPLFDIMFRRKTK